MRTTLELPDELLERVKAKALERGISLKELVSTALAKEVGPAPVALPPHRVRFPIFSSETAGGLELTHADLARAENEEDRRRGAVPP